MPVTRKQIRDMMTAIKADNGDDVAIKEVIADVERDLLSDEDRATAELADAADKGQSSGRRADAIRWLRSYFERIERS